ncbi:hypothetical protein FB446DRAFT_735524 [Lentinula raphanica]|nr:hypothetical protein FB446DRAFT_735524 [Lentinula raphanica]
MVDMFLTHSFPCACQGLLISIFIAKAAGAKDIHTHYSYPRTLLDLGRPEDEIYQYQSYEHELELAMVLLGQK